MGAVIGVIAFLIALAGLLASLGHAGYLAMLGAAAKKRPGGQPAVDFARKRVPVAAGAVALAAVAELAQMGGVGADVFAILLGGGAGLMSVKQLSATQQRFRNGQY